MSLSSAIKIMGITTCFVFEWQTSVSATPYRLIRPPVDRRDACALHASARLLDGKIHLPLAIPIGRESGEFDEVSVQQRLDELATDPTLDALAAISLSPPAQAAGIIDGKDALSSVARLTSPAEVRAAVLADAPQSADRLARRIHSIGWVDLHSFSSHRGDTFFALDVTGRPNIVASLGFDSHEVRLIRRLLAEPDTKSLQVLLRGVGKTPDLLVNGRVVEMKSIFHIGTLPSALRCANAQVHPFTSKHGLKPGWAFIELPHSFVVPTEIVLEVISRTAALSAIEQIVIYAAGDKRSFARRHGGLFHEAN